MKFLFQAYNNSFFNDLSKVKTTPYFLFIVLLFFLINCSSLQAQVPGIDFKKVPINVDGGFSEGVAAITQDQEGFIWLITSLGLAKYDGYKFKIYRSIKGDSTSLLDDRWLESLFVDYTGDLWVGSTSGLSRYDADCDCFFQYPFSREGFLPLDGRSRASTVTDITEDPAKNLWVAVSGGGLLRYERKNDRFTRFLDDPNDPNALNKDIVRVLLADQQNNIWIGTGYRSPSSGSGIIRFNRETGKAKRFKHDPTNSYSLLDNRVTAILEGQQGRIWVGTYQCGLHYFDPKKEAFIRMMPDAANPNNLHAPSNKEKLLGVSAYVSILHQDRKGGFWIGTIGKGINHFDGDTGNLTFYNPGNRNYWAINEDRQGQLWLGNLAGGLYKMDLFGRKFILYTAFPYVQKSCESKINPNVLWLGTKREGLKRLDLKTNEIISFQHDEKNNGSIGDNKVKVVYEDQNGQLWIGLGINFHDINRGFGNGGLDRLDINTNTFHHYPIKSHDTLDFNHTVYSIQEDQEGFLWLGTGRGGLFRSDKAKKRFNRYNLPANNGEHQDSEVYFVEEVGGFLWATDETDKGILYRYNVQKNAFSPYLKGFKTTFMEIDHKGWYWIGVFENGLLHLNPADTSYTHYTVKDGLPGNIGVHVVVDEAGTIWVGTEDGLAIFDAKTKRFTSNGLPGGFFHPCGFKTHDGRILFSSNQGLYVFSSSQVNGNSIPPDVSLISLKISGKPYDLNRDSLAMYKKIILSHEQNDFNIEFIGIHNTDPSRNQYKYKLAPYDTDWIDAGTQRSIRYINLDPGEYFFQVIASNSDGVWNKEGASLPFYIAPPWWTKWWAYVLYIASSCAIIYGFYQFQLSKKLAIEEGRRQKEVNKLKTRLYANITHEFRTPLTVILGMSDSLKSTLRKEGLYESGKSLEMIQRNGKNLLRLVNDMLDLTKLESGNLALDLAQSNVIPFVKYLCESFQSLAKKKQINLVVYSETEEVTMDFDAQKLSGIFSNLLSNAIKFTPSGGKIIVHINQINKQERTYFLIKIKDTGQGIAKSDLPNIFNRFYQTDNSSTRQGEGTGIGLALTKELVELMSGIIEVNSTIGKGSEFILLIPITRNAPITPTTQLTLKPVLSSETTLPSLTSPPQDTPIELPLVLIIEDNVDVVHYLKSCLEKQYKTLYAINGQIGIEMAFENIPDIIICDVMMPEKDGFEVCATLKTDQRTDHIPIIILTAKVTTQDRLTGLAHGADAYLAKPFEKAELMLRMDKLMQIRQTLQKKYSSTLIGSETQNETPKTTEAIFIEKIQKIILEHLEDEDFSVHQLARSLHFSRSHIHRKIKALTGMSTSIYIRFVRLEKAKELLTSKELTISEVAYRVGFKSPVYFSQAFKEVYKTSPNATRK